MNQQQFESLPEYAQEAAYHWQLVVNAMKEHPGVFKIVFADGECTLDINGNAIGGDSSFRILTAPGHIIDEPINIIPTEREGDKQRKER